MTPKSQERIFDPSYAHELINIAEGDLDSTRVLLRGKEHGEGRWENIFYFAQQAIEKSLKAVLCFKGLPVPLVHDLGVLLGRLPSDTEADFGFELTQLTQFATVRRYEAGRMLLTIEEARDTVAMATKVVTWAATVIRG